MTPAILSLVLSLAPADPASVEPWSPAPDPSAVAAEPDPAPAAEPAPAPAPMPMPVPAPAPAAAQPPAGSPKPDAAPPPPPRRERTWPVRPIRWRLDIAGELGSSVVYDPAWGAFDTYNRSVFHLGATVRGDVRLAGGRLFLGGGATFRRFASSGTIYGIFDNDILVREPLAFARLSVVALEGLDIFVQAGGGPSFARIDTRSVQFNDDYRFSSYAAGTQRAVLGVADAQAGVSLYLPKNWLPRRGSSRVTAGVEIAAGYTFRSQLAVRPELVTDDDPITTHSTDLGDVAMRGLTWRFGLFLRFQ